MEYIILIVLIIFAATLVVKRMEEERREKDDKSDDYETERTELLNLNEGRRRKLSESDINFLIAHKRIAEGRDYSDVPFIRPEKGSLLSSVRTMITIKPNNGASSDFSYVSKTDYSKNFCAFSLYRLENYSASACRVGLVKVKNGAVLEEKQIDFRPYKLTKRIQSSLGEERVSQLMSLPEFPEVWSDIQDMLDMQIAITYNEGYEISALSYLLRKYELQYKPITFLFSIGKTQQRLHNYLEENGLEIQDDDCLSLAKLITSIEIDNTLIRDDLKALKKNMWRKL